jgi:hypothetical protein
MVAGAEQTRTPAVGRGATHGRRTCAPSQYAQGACRLALIVFPDDHLFCGGPWLWRLGPSRFHGFDPRSRLRSGASASLTSCRRSSLKDGQARATFLAHVSGVCALRPPLMRACRAASAGDCSATGTKPTLCVWRPVSLPVAEGRCPPSSGLPIFRSSLGAVGSPLSIQLADMFHQASCSRSPLHTRDLSLCGPGPCTYHDHGLKITRPVSTPPLARESQGRNTSRAS